MKKLLSVLLICAMILASALAIIPASAADTVKVNFLPDGLYDAMKAAYEADGASTSDYVPSVTPFAYTNYAVNEKLADSKLLSISIPVRKTLAVDADGNFTFTLCTYKEDGITNSEPLKTYVIKINAKAHGLEANKSNVFKFIKVDLTSYNIVVGEGEILAFAGKDDTLLPAWASNDNSNIQKKAKEMYVDLVGFACNIGKTSYSANANSTIFFDLELEKKAGWDKVEESGELDFTYYDTKKYMPDEVFADLKKLFEADGANTLDWVPSVAPFTPTNAAFQNLMEGTRLRSITLPIRKTLAADSDGNFKFTISTFKRDKLTNSSPVNSYVVKINAAEYGLTPNTAGIYKFIKIDLTKYNIVVNEGEVLAFSTNGDTILPGYSGNVVSFLQNRFPIMMGFGAYTGKSTFTANTWPNACIFFDMEYDVPVIKEYVELRDAIAEVDGYSKDDYTAGWDNFALTLDGAKKTLEEKPESAEDLAGVLEALNAAVSELVPLANVDLTALATAITEAKKLDGKEDEYTPNTWAIFAQALADAETVKNSASPKQSVANAATKALTEAQALLQKKPDLDSLKAEIDKCEALTAADYVAATWQVLADALEAAKTLYADVNATASEVETVIGELKAAYDALDKKCDPAALQAKYDKTLAEVNRDEYTANSYNKLNEVLHEVEALLKTEEIGEKSSAAYIAQIDELIAALKKKANIDELKALVVEWEGVTDKEYHPDGLEALTEALEEINEACKPAKAANVSVEDAEALKAALDAAIAGLKKYADYTEIDAKLAQISNLNKDEYSEETWQKLEDARNAVNELKSNRNATEDEAATVLEALKAAIEGLAKKELTSPTDENKATEDEANGNDQPASTGCGSTVALGAVVVVSTLGFGVAVVSKKKD